jgi:hypothetical protein
MEGRTLKKDALETCGSLVSISFTMDQPKLMEVLQMGQRSKEFHGVKSIFQASTLSAWLIIRAFSRKTARNSLFMEESMVLIQAIPST